MNIAVFDVPVSLQTGVLLLAKKCFPVMKGKVWLMPSDLEPSDLLNLVSELEDRVLICSGENAVFQTRLILQTMKI